MKTLSRKGLSVFKIPAKAQLPLRVFAIVMSGGFFVYLIWRTGPSKLWKNFTDLGWGIVLVFALAGVSHFARTWGWRLSLGEDQHKVSFSRMVGLRLGAEAAGQLGILGQTLGDSVRVSRMSAEIPVASSLASVTLDRGFYVVTGLLTTIAGIIAALPLVTMSHALRLYASLFATALIAFLLLALIAIRKRWPALSWGARIIARVPSLRNWMESRFLLIQSVENALFDFHHKTPSAFWASFSLNLAAQCLAVSEVCLILWLLGVKMGFLSAMVIEALTKLVNAVGSFNPGNFGTYEGGTMLIGKMFGLAGTTGLALGLSRRLRSFFWAGVGAICLAVMAKARKDQRNGHLMSSPAGTSKDPEVQNEIGKALQPENQLENELIFAILLAKGETSGNQFCSPLARVGTLPILLRSIIAAQKAGATRIKVVADPATRRKAHRSLFVTGRLPESIEWIEAASYVSFSAQLQRIADGAPSARLVLVDGNKTYHPSLLRKATDWNDDSSALVLTSGERPIGIYVLSAEMIGKTSGHCSKLSSTLDELHESLSRMHSVVSMPVPENRWQRVGNPEERRLAEQKLDRWLIKPTDGMYARLNRRISIPISRQLIKFPITANMVSIFTLGVGIASAGFLACGGYWSMLVGATLCLFASILDGCDGEVARLKLLESDFGCWLETACDYAFYLFLLVGMTVGLWRSSGSNYYLLFGGLLMFGAAASFVATGWQRHRLAAGRPEQLLAIWQNHAESRPSNPLLYIGRRMEFIVRRCFFPYALVVFAFLNIMNVAFVLSLIGANLVWPIALYSAHAFARTKWPVRPKSVASASASTASRDYAPGLS